MSEYLTRKEAIIKGEDLTPMSRAEAMLKKDDIQVFTRKESLIKEALNSGGSGGSLEQLGGCRITNGTNTEEELYDINCTYNFADLDFGVLVPISIENIEPDHYGSLTGLAKGYAIRISPTNSERIKNIRFLNYDTEEEDPSAGEVIYLNNDYSYAKVFKSSTVIMVELNVGK